MKSISRDHILTAYGSPTLSIVSGEKSWITATDGRRYLDFCNGVATNCLGHCHPELVDVLKTQADRLWQCSNFFDIAGQEALAKKLTHLSSAEAVFFCNSGVEAWEGAIKFARKTHHMEGNKTRWRCITLGGCFHGRSNTAIHASHSPTMTTGFGPPIDGFDLVEHGNINALEAAITDETAMICLEPVQGDGSGIRPASSDYLKDVRAVCDDHGLVLILDEVQCGVGRTGRFFAHEWADIPADIIMSAKGLGGGFPVGAILCAQRVADAIKPGDHGSTYGGNPMAMAVANKVVEIVGNPAFLETVCQTSARLYAALTSLADTAPHLVEDVRGKGFMLGLKFRDSLKLADIHAAIQRAGLLTAPAKDNVLRLLPPLNIGDKEIQESLDCLETAFGHLSKT